MDYRGVLGEFQSEYFVSRSRFIATAINIGNLEEAAEFIKEISKRYKDATHNCYAYIANPEMTEMKFSDAGEPQGTAGQPILEVLKKKKLACTAVVVTRYFGGVKLGTGGLAQAYTKVTAECLENALIADFKLSDYYKIKTPYGLKGKIERAIEDNGGEISEIIYDNEVSIIYAVPVSLTDNMKKELDKATSGNTETEFLYRKYYIYK
jgi:uncharacterized YigZ family protein